MIEIRNLCKVYEDDFGKVQALDNVSFALPSKGMVFIVGKSGCGKTTLLNIIGGLDNQSSGDVYINNRPLSSFSITDLDNYRNTTVGFVFQDFCLIERMNVKNNIKMALEFQNSIKQVDYNKLLKRFGLEGMGKRKPTQLSAGQKQRVAIARAIVKDPDIILADEPTGNVDEKTSAQILDILKEISKDKLVVVISHNTEEAYRYGDRIIEMFDGKIKSDKSINQYASEKLIVTNKEIILPGHGNISSPELEILNNVVQKSDGNITISQSPELFKDNDSFNSNSKIKLRKAKMSNTTKLKFSSFFFKKKLVFNLFIILLITFVTSFFSIVEILGFVKNNFEMNRMVEELGYPNLILKYKSQQANLAIDETFIDVKCEEYGIEHDYIYNISFGMTPYSTYSSSYSLPSNRPNYILTNKFKNGYIIETNGVMVLSKEKFNSYFEDYTVLAGEIKETGSGVIITDYVADSLINLNSKNFSSYEDIVNGGYINERVDVDAVIQTDVYEKYPDLFKKWSTYSKEMNVKNILNYFYSTTFSLNPNFRNDFLKDYKEYNTPFIHIPSYTIKNEAEKQLKGTYGGFYFTDYLNKDEIEINYATYNQYFGGKYNASNLHTFKGDTIIISFCDTESNEIINKELKVTKLFTKSHYYDHYKISKSLFDELYGPLTFSYSVSVNSDKGKIFDFLKDLDSLEYKYYMPNQETHYMYSTINLFSAFKSVFRFLSYLLIAAIALIIILNANTLIKHNVYEIGLMKAFGAKTKDLVIMFATQMFFSSLIVCALLYTSSELFIALADTLLKKGIVTYSSIAKPYLNFHTFVFLDGYFFLNIGLIASSTILSVIVPILAIRRIKPLTIIRTRN